MFYDYAITVKAKTKENDPEEAELELTKGIIHRVEVEFYPGPRRYVFIRILHGLHQVWPTNPEGTFRTDAYTIGFDEYYELKAAPYKLRVIGYSPDADYDHVVTVRIGIIESRTALMLLDAIKGMTKLLHLVGIKV
ncbi:hypothetical protein ES708_20586 [subsurface metagenome]